MKTIFLSILFFPVFVVASERTEQFQNLEKNAEPMGVIAILLKPYGKFEEFKIFDESLTSQECTNKTIIRATVGCTRKENIKKSLYFAEGNGLLCKISDELKAIRCLPR